MSKQPVQAVFTVIRSNENPLVKTYFQDHSEGQTFLVDGIARTVAVRTDTDEEFLELSASFTQYEAITLGVIDPRPGFNARIVSQNRFDQIKAQGLPTDGIYTRTKDCFKFFAVPHLVVIDSDSHWMPKYAPRIMEYIFNDFAFLPDLLNLDTSARPSSSSRVSKAIKGWHFYMFCRDGTKIPEYGQRLFNYYLSQGWGFGALTNPKSSSPRILVRGPIDDSTFQAERLIYEADPIVVPPLQLTPNLPIIRGPIRELEPPDIDVSQIRSQIIANMEPLRIKSEKEIRENYVESEVKRLGEDARARANHQFTISSHTVCGKHPIYTDKRGEHSISDILCQDIMARATGQPTVFHEETCADPHEPDYGGSHGRPGKGKAKIFTDANPNIHSFAHGGTKYSARILPEDIVTQLNRGKELHLTQQTMQKLLFDLWRVTHFEDEAIKTHYKRAVLGAFEDKESKATARDIIKQAENEQLPDIQDADAIGDLGSVRPEPYYVAEYIAAKAFERIIFQHPDTWMIFNNGWEIRKGSQFLAQFVNNLQHKLAGVYKKKAPQILNYKFYSDTIHYLKQHAMAREKIDFDKDFYHIQSPNMAVDLRSCEIRPKRKTDYALFSTSVDPIPGPCPTYMRMMDNICGGDAEFFEDLEYCLVYAIFWGLPKQIITIIGPTNSGKSVLLGMIADMLGGTAAVLNPEFFMKKENTNEERVLMPLVNKRLGIGMEAFNSSGYLDVARLKRVSGRDHQVVRELYHEARQVVIEASVIGAGNFPIRMEKSDKAFSERVLNIELDRVFVLPNGREPNPYLNEYPGIPDLQKKLRAELPHIFHRYVERAFGLKGHTFHPPERFKLHWDEFDTKDVLTEWIMSGSVHICPQQSDYVTDFVPYTEIRQHFLAFYAMKNYKSHPPGDREFQRFLDDHGIFIVREGEKIVRKDNETACVSPGDVVRVDGKPTRLRKNVRLTNVFGPSQPEDPSSQRAG